jgi:putative serine protease PepD
VKGQYSSRFTLYVLRFTFHASRFTLYVSSFIFQKEVPMFPYQFDPPTPTPPAESAPAPAKRNGRKLGATLALVLALAGGAVGGGVVGATAATRWLAPTPPPVAVAPISAPVAAAPIVPIPAAPAASTIAGDVYNRVGAAAVEIAVTGRGGRGSGSGVVVDTDGHILTNNHVVEGARRVNVRFSDGTTREAEVLRTDTSNDLAVIRVDLPADSVIAALGDSDAVQVGDPVVAIGNPFGLEQTVTQGIVSAVQREWGRGASGLIQTDAPINPGNSGGPLLNANGDVIGINSMIASPVRGSVGIGFAIPSNTARELLEAS